MEEAFQQLQNLNQNNVDNLVKWMKDSNIVENTQAGEDKAKELLGGVKDKSNVEYDEFKGAVTKLAGQQKKTFDELKQKIIEEFPKFLSAVKEAAVTAATTALTSGTSAAADVALNAFKSVFK